tara:strand:+ start:9646 stop:10149 length:504 start_codon:yes stop_codon:yes gene_type:complete
MSVGSIRALMVLQILFALLFLLQFFGGIFGIQSLKFSWEWNEIIEIATVLGLIIGVVASFFLQRKLLDRNLKVEGQLLLAQGEFGKLLQTRFDMWDLTNSERDVALMTIKGFSITEIGQMRGTSGGTIKAQNAAIYRKAGVAGRNQLLVGLVEDLIDVSVTEMVETN